MTIDVCSHYEGSHFDFLQAERRFWPFYELEEINLFRAAGKIPDLLWIDILVILCLEYNIEIFISLLNCLFIIKRKFKCFC